MPCIECGRCITPYLPPVPVHVNLSEKERLVVVCSSVYFPRFRAREEGRQHPPYYGEVPELAGALETNTFGEANENMKIEIHHLRLARYATNRLVSYSPATKVRLSGRGVLRVKE